MDDVVQHLHRSKCYWRLSFTYQVAKDIYKCFQQIAYPLVTCFTPYRIRHIPTQCFPLTETWYQVYRSYEVDPVLGGTSKCVRATETGAFENDVAPVLLQYDTDVNM